MALQYIARTRSVVPMLWVRLRAVNELGGGRLPRQQGGVDFFRRKRFPLPRSLSSSSLQQRRVRCVTAQASIRRPPLAGRFVPPSTLVCICVCARVAEPMSPDRHMPPQTGSSTAPRRSIRSGMCGRRRHGRRAARWTGARRDSARGAYSSRNPSDVLASTMIHVVPQGWLPANDEPMPQRQQPLRR
jgi:hypothetical protein